MVPTKARVTATQVKREPSSSNVSPPARENMPAQKKAVAMKTNTLIHKIADWLERKYLSRNTWSARASWACPSTWYRLIASRDNKATTTVSWRKGRQNQASPTKDGAVPN